MEALITLAILTWLACYFYKSGKRTGSRKAYNVGRRHARQSGHYRRR